MNKKYLVLALFLIALLSFVIAKAATDSGSQLVTQIEKEFTGGCVDANTNDLKWDVKVYAADSFFDVAAARLDWTEVPDSFFDVSYQGGYANPSYLDSLAISAEQGRTVLNDLVKSEGLNSYDSLPPSNFRSFAQNIKTAINTAGLVSDRAAETVKNSADKTKRILESETVDITQAQSDVSSMLNQVSEQMTQTGNLGLAANLALSTMSSSMSAKESVKTASDNLATASILLDSALEFSKTPDKNAVVLAYAQLTESAAFIHIASIRYALVYFMLFNDIKENPKHYEKYKYTQGPPCSLTPEMPCTGCEPPDFWASVGCPVQEQDNANQITAAAVAEPITEFPTFDTSMLEKALEFSPVNAEPSFVAVLDSNIRQLEIQRNIFLSDRGIRVINNALYLGKTRVNIGTNGVIDYYTGDPIQELSLDDIHTYKQMKFLLEDLFPAIRTVAVLESNKGPAEQHIKAYDKMIKINLDYIDLRDLQERENIWAARISEESKEKRIAYTNFRTTQAKINAIESVISNKRLNQVINARPDISVEIKAVIKERTPKNTQEILRLLTNDDLLAEYYSALKHTLEAS